jgi:hypothetical protein
MTRRWEAFWVFFNTGYDDPTKRESIEEDYYYTDETGSSSVDGSYCGRGLPVRGVEVKLRPQIRGTDLKVLGFNIGAQVARGSTVPASRPGVFP